MSLEKPWQKPFEKLLQEFLQQCRGEISRPGSKGELPSWGDDLSFFFYPTFHGELQGQTFTIEISEFPASGFSDFEAADNVEYLRIFITKPTEYSVQVIHESWFHRLEKKFHLDREFQTGNSEFDRRYYLRSQADKDRQLLQDPRFQEMIMSLESFSVLQVLDSGVRWSQMISDEKQLEFLVVDDYLKRMLKLAATISAR